MGTRRELSSPEKGLPESNIERTEVFRLCAEIFACNAISERANSSCVAQVLLGNTGEVTGYSGTLPSHYIPVLCSGRMQVS